MACSRQTGRDPVRSDSVRARSLLDVVESTVVLEDVDVGASRTRGYRTRFRLQFRGGDDHDGKRGFVEETASGRSHTG